MALATSCLVLCYVRSSSSCLLCRFLVHFMKVIQKLHKEHITSSMSAAEAQSESLCGGLHVQTVCALVDFMGEEGMFVLRSLLKFCGNKNEYDNFAMLGL